MNKNMRKCHEVWVFWESGVAIHTRLNQDAIDYYRKLGVTVDVVPDIPEEMM
jgi:hypothetical protein